MYLSKGCIRQAGFVCALRSFQVLTMKLVLGLRKNREREKQKWSEYNYDDLGTSLGFCRWPAQSTLVNCVVHSMMEDITIKMHVVHSAHFWKCIAQSRVRTHNHCNWFVTANTRLSIKIFGSIVTWKVKMNWNSIDRWHWDRIAQRTWCLVLNDHLSSARY